MQSAAELRMLLRRLDGEPADAIESETIECKAWDPHPAARDSQFRELRETVVCLANQRGGTILLGISDRKRTRRDAIHGVSTLDAIDVRRNVYGGTEPAILVEVEDLIEPEGRILVIRVPRGLPPHTTSDGVGKIRVGKECRPLTGSALSRLLLSRGQRDLTAETVPGATPADLDAEVLGILRNLLQSDGGKPDLARQPEDELLRNLGLVRSGEVTLAAILLLGRPAALARFAPQHEVVFLRFKGQTRYDVRHDLKGPLLSVLDALKRILEAHLRVTTTEATGFSELHIPELSWRAAREAVLNALVHRDYFLHQSVIVELRSGQIVVSSPGGFVGGVVPQNVLRHPPVRRNPLLAEVFQTIGFVNRAGLGVDRIYEELLRLGKAPPRYDADEANVRLTLATRTHLAFARFVAEQDREGRRLELDDLILLRGLADRGALDRWSAAEALQLPEEDAAQQLVSLRARGYVVPKGRGRGTSYRLGRLLSDLSNAAAETDRDARLDDEAVRPRVLAALAERGKLTNAELRGLSGYSREEVLRLMRSLRADGLVVVRGRGRGACYKAVTKRLSARKGRS